MYNIFNQPITNIKNKMSEDDNKKVDKKAFFSGELKVIKENESPYRIFYED